MHISDKIDHFVVLMYENRSFDNILGTLPHPGDGPRRFDGIPAGWELPEGPYQQHFHAPFLAMDDVVGAGPSHHHVNTLKQLVGPVHDWEAEFGDSRPWMRVAQRWDDLLAQDRTNRGFVWDYRDFEGQKFSRIMGTWDDGFIPAIWTLALNYGVCQRWFSSLPGQTQPNRLFSLCGHSFGFVDNGKPLRVAPQGTTVFARLDEAGADWGFFANLSALTPHITKDLRVFGRRQRLSRFFELAKEGSLPAFSYLEPSNFLPAESQHPGQADGPRVLERGDGLLASVYNALRSNESAWRRTLLVVTWDEHGGFPDHVPPPRAVAPELSSEPDNQGFDFTLLGLRVPALVISPWVSQARIDDKTRDHTSILATVRELYSLKTPFSAREASISSLSSMLEDELLDPDDRPSEVEDLREAIDPIGEASELGDLKLDAHQRDVAEAMLNTVMEESIDIGSLAGVDPAAWKNSDFQALCRSFVPILGEDDE